MARILSPTEKENLLQDWFSRSGKHFVKVSKARIYDWEDTLEEGEAYSTFLIKNPDKFNIVKKAYGLARETLVAMDLPCRVNVSIGGDSSFTDGKNVKVSTKFFDDKELSTAKKIDIFMGLTIHEGLHIKYTDFKCLKKLTEHKYPKLLTLINNLIEDERIESLCGEETPGHARFLEAPRYYFFELQKSEYPYMGTDLQKILFTITSLLRYPKDLVDADLDVFGEHLLKIKALLVPDLPENTKGSIETSEKILEILEEFIKEEKVSSHSITIGMDGSGTGKSEEDEESEGGTGSSSEEKDEEEKEGEEKEGDGEKPSEEEKDESEEEKEERVKKAMEALDSLADSVLHVMERVGASTMEGDMDKVSSKDLKGVDKKVVEGTAEFGEGDKTTIFEKATKNPYQYKDSLDRVRRYIPAIRNTLKGHCKEYKLVHRAMRSGVLDTDKLAEAIQGVPTVYRREGEVTTDKVSVVLLVDESGSMGSTKSQAARDTAILLSEALGTIPHMGLYVYGHSADETSRGDTNIRIYREGSYKPKEALGTITARRENRDGTAILNVAKRVRKLTKVPCLYFIISDGAPSASDYHGSSAILHTKKCVEQVEKMDFDVIQVCIEAHYNPADMFKHFVVLKDMRTLAPELTKIIKKASLRKAKNHVI